MSDLLFISGAFLALSLCFIAMVWFAIYTLRELLQDPLASRLVKWGVTSIVVAFGLMLIGIALKMMENL